MDVKICRVCRETSENMTNIFDGIPDRRISIADMISQCTGFRVTRDDSFPKTICSPCKQDATNAYEIKQLYETSHRVFCQIEKDLKEGQDLLKEEICEISDYEGTGTRQVPYEVKKEEIGQGSVEKKLSGRDDFHGQVKNEPIEEDISEEDHLGITDSDVDQFDFQVKAEEFNDYTQREDQRYDDSIDHKGVSPIKDVQHPHKCSYCQKSFLRIQGLTVHIRTHTGERPYKCSHCQKSFPHKDTLKKHIRTHTGERPYKCSYCKMSFAQNGSLNQHIRTHTGERPHKCSHCQKPFSNKSNLRKHIQIHTGERPYKCSHCQKSFSNKTNLQKHSFTHTGERPYKCSYCEKSYLDNPNLQIHIRTHTGERPFKCSHCQKSYSRKGKLQGHILTHTGERPYKCSHCQKSFSDKTNLQKHIRTHTGERPYECSHCQKSFSLKQNLQSHIRTHTGEEVFPLLNALPLNTEERS